MSSSAASVSSSLFVVSNPFTQRTDLIICGSFLLISMMFLIVLAVLTSSKPSAIDSCYGSLIGAYISCDRKMH